MVYSYTKQAPGLQPLFSQHKDIVAFSVLNAIAIDKEVVEHATKKFLLEERKEFEAFLQTIKEGDTVIISALNILTDRVEEVVKVIYCLLSHNAHLWIVNENICIDQESSVLVLVPLLDRLREEEQKNKQIGRPKGSKSNSKFDVYQREIMTLLSEGLSVSAISRKLQVSRSSLKDYIESRQIKALLESAWTQRDNEVQMDNVVLICPFQKDK
ncbi:MAG: hypothetical protein RLZZ428_43 [Pseudomonadota bacterium]